MDDQGKIDAVNCAIREFFPCLREMAKQFESIQIRYSVLEFADNAHWLNIGTDIESGGWIDISVSGKCCRGKAYVELAKKLTRDIEGGVFAKHCNRTPIIVLITNSQSQDEVTDSLSLLKRNKWFHYSARYVLDLSGNIDRQELIAFTGSEELILPASNGFKFLKEEIYRIITSPIIS